MLLAPSTPTELYDPQISNPITAAATSRSVIFRARRGGSAAFVGRLYASKGHSAPTTHLSTKPRSWHGFSTRRRRICAQSSKLQQGAIKLRSLSAAGVLTPSGTFITPLYLTLTLESTTSSTPPFPPYPTISGLVRQQVPLYSVLPSIAPAAILPSGRQLFLEDTAIIRSSDERFPVSGTHTPRSPGPHWQGTSIAFAVLIPFQRFCHQAIQSKIRAMATVGRTGYRSRSDMPFERERRGSTSGRHYQYQAPQQHPAARRDIPYNEAGWNISVLSCDTVLTNSQTNITRCL